MSGVLISSAGRRVALVEAFKNALTSLDIYGAVVAGDCSRYAPAMSVADYSVNLPDVAHAGYIKELIRVCRHHNIGMVIPTIDTELTVLARNKEKLDGFGIRAIVPDERVVGITQDKRLTHRHLHNCGIPVPRQWSSLAEAQLASPHSALIVKPSAGSASVGVQRYSTIDAIGALSPEYILEEEALGTEFTLDLYVRLNGSVACVVPRERLKVRAGEVAQAVTRRVPDLIALGKDVAAALEAPGCVLTVQVFYDPSSGIHRVIEVNPRFGGGYPLTQQAGADFPKALIREHLLHGWIEDFDNWQEDLLMTRYDAAIYGPLSHF